MRRIAALLERTRLHAWYAQLGARDRNALLLLAAFTAATTLWLAVLRPTIAWRHEAAERHARALAGLTWMQANRRAVQVPAGSAVAGEPGLLSAVAAAARAHQVTLSRYQPESTGQVTVELQNQSFNAVIGWIEALHHRQGIEVTFLNLQRAEAPGVVNGRIRFRR